MNSLSFAVRVDMRSMGHTLIAKLSGSISVTHPVWLVNRIRNDVFNSTIDVRLLVEARMSASYKNESSW